MTDMVHSSACTDIIMSFEGYHKRLTNGDCKAYLDKLVRPALRSKGYAGLWTIGWGCTGAGITEGTIWTRARAVAENQKIIARHAKIVNRLVKVPLTQNQFDALTSLSYNLGLTAAKTLIARLNRGDYAGAADAFTMYNRSGGKVISGLVRRRAAERRLFLSKKKPPTPVQASRRLTLIQRVRQFIAGLGVTAATVSSFLGDVWQWVKDNPELVAVAALTMTTAFWLILKWVEQTSVQDYREGRYTPSKYDE